MAAGGGFGSGFGFGFEFDQEGNLPGGSFSRLLLSDDVVSPPIFPVSPPHPPCTPLFSFDTPKMLCFGDFSEGDETGGSQITSQSVCSSPVSKSSSNASINSLPNSSNCNKRRNGSPPPPREKEAAGDLSGAGAPAPREQSGSKKSRPAAPANGSRSGAGHAKKLIPVKKREKLGDRIATLQQLVSPYGKTDTASVLHETMGYIRFLQDQVKVLCSPYLQRLPSSLPSTSRGEKYECRNFTQGQLKSKGLCLVPVDGIVEMTNCNGADLWSQVTSKDVVAATTTNAAAATTTTTVVATTTATSSIC